MSPEESRAQAGFHPEVEQEVDFGRYLRLIGARWWVVAAGLVLGAIVGYAVSLGGSQVYKATATLYLGQPYSASGGIPLQTLQTNPSTVRVIATSTAVEDAVAAQCKTKASTFRGGISTQPISGNLSKNGQNPLVALTVQSSKRKVAACAANGLVRAVLARISVFENQKIARLNSQVAVDDASINRIKTGLASASLSTSLRLLFQIQLGSIQSDRKGAAQLLLQATQVEAPKVLTPAAAQLVTARSRRNSVVVAALIGLILGVIAALMWDGVAAGLSRRRPA
jgi:hypothetical protein